MKAKTFYRQRDLLSRSLSCGKLLLEKTFQKYLPLINKVAEELLTDFVDKKFHQTFLYQLKTGGKRIRPFLAIVCCKLLGGSLRNVIYPAAGLEILHNCTLIIDDIIDHSFFRRSLPTCWRKFGNSIAECIALSYNSSLLSASRRSPKPVELSLLFEKTLKTIIQGEILDILFERGGREKEPFVRENRYLKISEKDYFEMIGKKTAILFEASCQVGAICARATKKEIEALKSYGFNLGIAFQIKDDILDIFGEVKKFGKKIGKDIEERKGGNIVILLANQELSKKEREKIEEVMIKKKILALEIKKVIETIKKTTAKERAEKLGEKFIQRAKSSLEIFPDNKWKMILTEIADFIIKRES